MSGIEQSMTGVHRPSVSATTVVMVAGVIASTALFVLVFFLYLRAKRYWGAIPVSIRGRLAEPAAAQQRSGLDAAAAVGALPSVVVRAGDCKEGLECAVCLCELSRGEAARLLPTCGHAFHIECIDAWFSSHSTCPLCRSPVVHEKPQEAGSAAESVPGRFHSEEPPPEIEDQAGRSSSPSDHPSGSTPAVSVSETPRIAVDGFQTLNSSAATLRSLRRLLICGSRTGGASCSSRECDVEQGRLPV
ncbi:unnamed protein product [Musa acuminata subsp. malaccensis]|uniref:(wild Malaysian banana) hypothetical protein n=1 Tax=Musa acuminata subsp. malaccensis TaxID=214687 RepID=A0A804I7E5_MUSAM|nr:PREDICTED: RING-H2 finger protein ATL3-like [Musa acuminata subsp. malaccensis]XP_009390885.1 PREDICTED: RING-H2 finger protein ATL3-like [Musa acuminata subsp. malaccensis]XP_018678635.1 PREDICTED: RING-H2 finger protein ATL3-like [Musa acuminata subsp. malaccensis]CAG1848886.1 unnamed protein product [Musa acuminata subsp. malaccensis]